MNNAPYSFGPNSRAELSTCRTELAMVAHKAINYVDFSVTEGARTTDEQVKLFREGKTTLDGVKKISKHQTGDVRPYSLAFDFVPYPTTLHGVSVWQDLDRFRYVAGIIVGVGASMGITLRWGGDWNRDTSNTDQTFHDLPHIELLDA